MADCSFVKIQHGVKGKTNLESECKSLEEIEKIRPSLVPESLGHGTFASDKDLQFLVTVVNKEPTTLASAEKIGSEIAKLHLRNKNDYKADQGHGFRVPTGLPFLHQGSSTPKDWNKKTSWVEYFTELYSAVFAWEQQLHGRHDKMQEWFEKIKQEKISKVVDTARSEW